MEAIHKFFPLLVTFVSTTIDDPTPDLVAILTKLSLDVVGIVVLRFAVWGPLRRVFDSLRARTNPLFECIHVHDKSGLGTRSLEFEGAVGPQMKSGTGV